MLYETVRQLRLSSLALCRTPSRSAQRYPVSMSLSVSNLLSFRPAFRLLILLGVLLPFSAAIPQVARALGYPAKAVPFGSRPPANGGPSAPEEETHSNHHLTCVVVRQSRKQLPFARLQTRACFRIEERARLAPHASWLRARNAALPDSDHLNSPLVRRGPPSVG